MKDQGQTASKRRGVTLLELLVVMMILSLILTAAVKTWDVTLERGRFETTTRKLDQLTSVIVGNPNYTVSGQRVDFGYVGDMGKLPDNLKELIVNPNPGLPESLNPWRGPYIRATFNESPDGYRIDGWGDTITYNKDSLFVRSFGSYAPGPIGQEHWITRSFGYEKQDLVNNTVSGQVLDIRGIPPGDTLFNNLDIMVSFRGPFLGIIQNYPVVYGSNGQFTVLSVPQGNQYRLQARYIHDYPLPVDTVYTQRYVTVYPRVGARDLQVKLDVDWEMENNP